MRQRMQPHGGQLMMTTQVTTKVPPGFDGKTSWLAFEDAVDDWCDITKLEAEKWGPALRNRLEGEASVFKRLLDREELRQPNGRGVEYFKKTLRPHFVKGAQTVFLYRFMRFMKNNRGNGDLMKWMTRFQIDGRRLEESWMDLCPELDFKSCRHKAWDSKNKRRKFEALAPVGFTPNDASRKLKSGVSSCDPGWKLQQKAYLAYVSMPAASSFSISSLEMKTCAALCWKDAFESKAIAN